MMWLSLSYFVEEILPVFVLYIFLYIYYTLSILNDNYTSMIKSKVPIFNV